MSDRSRLSMQRAIPVWRCIVCALALVAAGGPAIGQSYPSRVVRVVLPVPPGGGVDAVGRILAQRIGEELGQSFVVENRAGASTVIGSAYVARAAPDGYTLLVNASLLILGPLITKNVPYDPLTDFAPVTQIATGPLLLVSSAKFPAGGIADLIALAKARPGQLSIANPGTGSSMDFAQAMFRLMAGIDVITPAYKGTGPAVVDVMSGEVSATFTTIPSALSLVRDGRLKALGVSSRTRSALVPEVPTVAESGLAGFEFNTWNGMWAPAKTPRDIVAKLQAAAARAVQFPAVRQLLVAQGLEPVGSTPEQFADYIRSDVAKHARLIRDANLKFE
jgi:tripartite-type tricarboxylate transporter receptor subunit TctC